MASGEIVKLGNERLDKFIAISQKQFMAKRGYKSERQFRDKIISRIDLFCEAVNIPKPVSYAKEVCLYSGGFSTKLSYGFSAGRIDLMIEHQDNITTIIEIKVPRCLMDLSSAISQLLVYREFLRTVLPKRAFRFIIVSDLLNPWVLQTIYNNALDIEVVGINPDGDFVIWDRKTVENIIATNEHKII